MLSRELVRLRWRYRKNRDDLFGLLGGYPGFVRARSPSPTIEHIPVFCFHEVAPAVLERQLQFLAGNGYRTLDADELALVLRRKRSCPERSVVLTFDDGTSTLSSVAYPLLRRYGLRAVAFVIAGLVPEHPTPGSPFCSWAELRDMQSSGVIDVQAHSFHHHRVLVSPHLVDFMHPRYPGYHGNLDVPAYRTPGEEGFTREVPLGTPIYRAEPLFAGAPEYFDDPIVRAACVRAVEPRGAAFFEAPGWERVLRRIHRAAAAATRGPARYGTRADAARAMREDLERCRDVIAGKLGGHRVRHLALPWFVGSGTAVRVARDAGYASVSWGFAGRRVVRPGDDPFSIARLNERYLERLPGVGRRPLSLCLLQGRSAA